ncbi:uncharacterized protein K460DRAFT_428509 [Cucurbitaria berberidis CBS 394.84]|uniref:Uncharacterized protein n=1 Tax=Cucurbitaria berberidis CBS 394.84 TaxID=1168544 RepID=A0A9P4GNY5_9PLEO|nr:uncharacterized protein K460DRAFT_428509 [Cucurbitaria berberidis CBS 394.84]KAF1849060.1 hypothetical protein K460DRAFT_428509 [Cucurbitaria berberidis CBS 394.84]
MAAVLYQMFANNFVRSARNLRYTRRAQPLRLRGARNASTLPENPHIYVHKHPLDPHKSLLSLLPTEPPTPQLAIGTCESLPVTPNNFTPNPSFQPILSSVYATHATSDPYVIQQASAYASPGSAGAGQHGGWIHVSDLRNPPDYGRIAWPEDILGSVEVDRAGQFSDGTWQDSGTYRIVTREGILGMTEFMRGKMVERLQQLEGQMKQKA